MKATGIIAEFNPFTNGHAYFISTIKKITGLPVIAVMSGSCVQRGLPAFADKFLRAKAAIAGGVDLVLELPARYTLASAEHFAKGGVNILRSTGCTKILACGIEHPDLNFADIAAKVHNLKNTPQLHELITKGKSYPQALKELIPELPETPNDILALEYTQAAPGLQMLYIPRHGEDYNSSKLGNYASATAVRQNWPNVENAVPLTTLEIIADNGGYDEQLYWKILQHTLRSHTTEEIADHCTATEGLENLLKKAENAGNLTEALKQCSTKRYPISRIRRLFLQLALWRPRAEYLDTGPSPLRILAFNDTGRALIKTMQNTANVPIITKVRPHPSSLSLPHLDTAATDLLATLQNKPAASDYTTSPIYLSLKSK